MMLFILLAGAYFAGSVNFSILLFRMSGKEDPRKKFSGNAGVTNVRRQAGILWAVIILLLDLGRAMAVAWMAMHFLEGSAVPWAGLALVAGNRFPCFHGFRGGKGVAGYLGFTILLSPLAAALACGAWVVVYGIVRIPFVASFFMVAVLAAGTIITCGCGPVAGAGTLATTLFIYYNHRRNIVALTGPRA